MKDNFIDHVVALNSLPPNPVIIGTTRFCDLIAKEMENTALQKQVRDLLHENQRLLELLAQTKEKP